MEMHECPHCNLPGLVTTVTVSSGHFEMSGKCLTCGYSYDSAYGPAEAADDLTSDYSFELEKAADDVARQYCFQLDKAQVD